MEWPRTPNRAYGATHAGPFLVHRSGQQSEKRRQALVAGQIIDENLFAIRVAQRHTPVRVLIRARARHILRPDVSHRIDERSNDELGRNLGDVTVQALDDLALAWLRSVDAPVLVQALHNLLKL